MTKRSEYEYGDDPVSAAERIGDDVAADLIEATAQIASTGGTYSITVNERQAQEMASGYVPNAIKAQLRSMIDWREEDERRAARPVVRDKRKKETAE